MKLEFCAGDTRTIMENGKMNNIVNNMEQLQEKLLAYARLLNRKIKSADKKAKNPYIDYDFTHNPFGRTFNNTLVWVEEDSKTNNNRKY